MKKLFLGLVSVSLLSAGLAYADKIIVSGEPVVVEKQGEYYVAPTTVSASDHYFFSVNNTKEVCYKEVQPSLAKVELGLVGFNIGGNNVSLHCYTYSPDYFVAQ